MSGKQRDQGIRNVLSYGAGPTARISASSTEEDCCSHIVRMRLLINGDNAKRSKWTQRDMQLQFVELRYKFVSKLWGTYCPVGMKQAGPIGAGWRARTSNCPPNSWVRIVSIGVDLRLHANSISCPSNPARKANRTYYCWIYLYCSRRTLELTSTVELAPLVKTPRYRIVLVGAEL